MSDDATQEFRTRWIAAWNRPWNDPVRHIMLRSYTDLAKMYDEFADELTKLEAEGYGRFMAVSEQGVRLHIWKDKDGIYHANATGAILDNGKS